MSELHRKYRPKQLTDLAGQPEAVKIMSSWQQKGKIPHTVLFSGPAGCGKTSSARLLAKLVGAHFERGKSLDVHELDCANVGSVDTVRSIRNKASLNCVDSKSKAKVYILDEVHAMRKEPQTAMLKLLEEPPDHVYLFLCTTDPGKMLTTVRSRCAEVKMQLLSDKIALDLLAKVAKAEGAKIKPTVFQKIVEIGAGSARKILVLLQQIIDLKNEEEQLDCLSKADAEKHGIDIARILFKRGARFADVKDLLKQVEDEPETVRRIILSYATAILLSSGQKYAFDVIDCFRTPYFDSGSGKPLLVAGCYEMLALAKSH